MSLGAKGLIAYRSHIQSSSYSPSILSSVLFSWFSHLRLILHATVPVFLSFVTLWPVNCFRVLFVQSYLITCNSRNPFSHSMFYFAFQDGRVSFPSSVYRRHNPFLVPRTPLNCQILNLNLATPLLPFTVQRDVNTYVPRNRKM